MKKSAVILSEVEGSGTSTSWSGPCDRTSRRSSAGVVFVFRMRFNGLVIGDDDVFSSRLESGERLLWSGQPKQGIRLQSQDIVLIPFSLMWGGFVIFWEASVLGLVHFHSGNVHFRNSSPPLFMALFGIPFVVVGLYMLIGRFLFDAAQRKKTFYAVTDRRLIILKTWFMFNLTSYDLGSASNLNINERSDGSGDIMFGSPSPMQWMASPGRYNTQNYRLPGFYLLPDAREVFSIIRNAQGAARVAPPR